MKHNYPQLTRGHTCQLRVPKMKIIQKHLKYGAFI